MEYKIVRLIYPYKSNNKISVSKVPAKNKTIYNTVDFFEQELSPRIKLINKKTKNKIQLRDIINLHNDTGIQDLARIKVMVSQIKSGKHVLSPRDLPNIKLVKTKNNEWVLFDGHHSMLAYMFAGKRYLNEIPHLIVENEQGYVADKEILVFFGEHSKKIKNWRRYVINWQAQKEKQLCRRRQNNMGELFKAIKKDLF